MVIYIQFPLTSRVASEAGAAMELVNRIQTVFIDVCGDQNSYRCRHISYDDGIVHSSLLVDESHRIRFDYTGIFFYPNYNSRLEFVPVGKSFTMTLLHFMDVVINYMPLSLHTGVTCNLICQAIQDLGAIEIAPTRNSRLYRARGQTPAKRGRRALALVAEAETRRRKINPGSRSRQTAEN